ncbi:MAG: outer membrane protein beta-barrel domain [Verrucomicrobiota bacterium]|jgi:opacity protein-like surface antigen
MKMTIRSLIFAGAGCVCLAARPGFAQNHGFYLNAEGGVALADQVNLKQFFGPTGGVQLDFDTGARFTASGGWNFNEYIGIEGETGFIYNSFRKIEASLSHVPMMANVVVRYDQPNCNWIPYAGVGAGGDVSIISLDNVTGNGVTADGSEATLEFAWQAFAGLRYRFNPSMSIGAGYKYYSVDGASWDFAGFNNSIRIGHANVHSILIEFNMKF